MKKFMLACALLPTILWADNLTISNETEDDVYVAVYYVPMIGKVTKASQVLKLEPGSNKKMQRPSQKLGSDREMLMLNQATFPSTVTKDRFKKSGSRINVGQMQGKRFYIGEQGAALRGYTVGEWAQRGKKGIVSSIRGKASTLFATGKAQVSRAYNAVVPEAIKGEAKKAALKAVPRKYWSSPHENTVAKVRTGNGISAQERAALAVRSQKVRRSMESKLGAIQRAPKIAVVASGGGYRAMIFTIGFLVGAQNIGLLDMVTWMSALSGSTWAMGCWLENNALKGRIAPDAFRSQFFNLIKDKALQSNITVSQVQQMSNLWLADAIAGKPFTLVNVYGSLLANRLLANFGDTRQALHLSDQQAISSSGDFPIPIYTGVSGETAPPNYWYAFTPWEVSMEPWQQGGVGISIPTWGYGRKFRNGSSTEYAPEQSLGFQLGTYGSAFAADVKTIYEEGIRGKIPTEFMRNLVDKVINTEIGGKRLTWAAVPNFARGVAQSPLRDADSLQIVDAGLDFNLPYPPVSGLRAERTPDIILFVDVSATINGVPEFKKTEAYARRKKLKFPPIDYSKVEKQAVSVHVDKNDPSVPIVIYVSRINDASQAALLNKPGLNRYKKILAGFDVNACMRKGSACNTMNFMYTYDDAMKLSTLAEFNIMAYKDEIFAAIKQRAGGRTP